MVSRIDNMARFACKSSANNITQAIVITEEALKLLKNLQDVTCNFRTEWICHRQKHVPMCNLCPAFNDKELYEQELAEIADRLCIKRNMIVFGEGFNLGDDCGREDISIGRLGRNCDECPACDDLFDLFSEYESAKDKKTFLAVENVAKQAVKKIRYIQSMNRLV